MRSPASIALALSAALLLTGCLNSPFDDDVSSGPGAYPDGEVAADGRTGAPGQTARAVPGPVNDDPARLLGLDPSALRAMLGEPGFMRRDNPAQLWRYAGADCVLDLFLYRAAPSGAFIVRHFEARAASQKPSAASVNPRACLGALLRARQSASTS